MHKMNQSLTAQDLFSEMKRMPAPERVKFFTLLSSNAFHEDGISHDQVFGHLEREPFSAGESAEYLEVSIATFRRSDVPALRSIWEAESHSDGWTQSTLFCKRPQSVEKSQTIILAGVSDKA